MADYNLSKWLKDDLGLKHLSEVDMHNLIYHPRHGSLCRRLIKFLTDSTLCTRKYPHVYAREQCEQATKEFHEADELAQKLLLKLEAQLRIRENTRSELNCTRKRHEWLVKIENMLRNTTEAFEAMASRPNFTLEQIGRRVENPQYLGDLSLEALYSSLTDDKGELEQQRLVAGSAMITRRDVTSANEEYEKLISRSQAMNETISQLLHSVISNVEKTVDANSDLDLRKPQPLERTNVEKLEALKAPECQQVEVDADPEERKLRLERERLTRELTECNKQVAELADQYKRAKENANRSYKRELEMDLSLLRCLHQKEAVLREGP